MGFLGNLHLLLIDVNHAIWNWRDNTRGCSYHHPFYGAWANSSIYPGETLISWISKFKYLTRESNERWNALVIVKMAAFYLWTLTQKWIFLCLYLYDCSAYGLFSLSIIWFWSLLIHLIALSHQCSCQSCYYSDLMLIRCSIPITTFIYMHIFNPSNTRAL